MPDTPCATVLTVPKRLAWREQKYPLEQLHTHSLDVTEAERAMQTLAGAFPEEQALPSAIVPQRILR